MNEPSDTVVVMTIDDEPENLNLLDDILRLEGWDVRAFTRGDQALVTAKENPPDLVLLDIRMPGIDGYEVCRQFKADDRLRSIPVIFLSAMTSASEKVIGFEAGCVDYVTKPFSEHEILARSRTHIQLYRNQNYLESIVRARAGELLEAHRRLRIWDDAKTDWINMLAHEMRTPLTGVFGTAELLFMELPHTKDCDMLREAYDESRQRIEKLIEDACMLAQIHVDSERYRLQAIPFVHSLYQALDTFIGLKTAVKVQVLISVSEHVTVRGLPELLRRAWGDLLLTAACCVQEGGSFSIQADYEEDRVRTCIRIADLEFHDTALECFFEVGGQRVLLKGGGDFGLGAALARRIINLFGGQVSVCNAHEHSVVIEIIMPAEVNNRIF